MEPTARLPQGEPEETTSPVVKSGLPATKSGNKGAGAGLKSSQNELNCSRLEARVFELENRLRETEEELQFYFEFFKKAKKAGLVGSSGEKQNQRQGDQQHKSKNRDDDSADDSDQDDEAPSYNHYYTGDTCDQSTTACSSPCLSPFTPSSNCSLPTYPFQIALLVKGNMSQKICLCTFFTLTSPCRFRSLFRPMHTPRASSKLIEGMFHVVRKGRNPVTAAVVLFFATSSHAFPLSRNAEE